MISKDYFVRQMSSLISFNTSMFSVDRLLNTNLACDGVIAECLDMCGTLLLTAMVGEDDILSDEVLSHFWDTVINDIDDVSLSELEELYDEIVRETEGEQ